MPDITQYSKRIPQLLQKRNTCFIFVKLAAALCLAVCFFVFRTMPDIFAARTGDSGTPNYFSMVLFAAVPALVLWYFGNAWVRNFIRRSLGRDVLAPLAGQAAHGMTFTPDEQLPKEYLGRSLLFDGEGEGKTTLVGAGIVTGEGAGCRYRASALKVDKKVRYGCRILEGTVFGGIFVHMGRKHDNNGFVVVSPRAAAVTADMALFRLGKEQEQNVVEVPFDADVDFDRWFIVIASAKECAERVLTEQMRARLVRLLEKDLFQPSLSVRGTDLFLILESRREFWHLPEYTDGILSDSDAETLCSKFYEDFGFLGTLVTELGAEE